MAAAPDLEVIDADDQSEDISNTGFAGLSITDLRDQGGSGESCGETAEDAHMASVQQQFEGGMRKVIASLDARWTSLPAGIRQQLADAKGGNYGRFKEWDFNNLHLQRLFVNRRFLETAENVYNALRAIPSHLQLAPGLVPEIILLGCGAAPELVAVKVYLQEVYGVTSARYRLVDSANWDHAWGALDEDYLRKDKLDFGQADQTWYNGLAGATLVTGWFVHEDLQKRQTIARLQDLADKGVTVLLGCPKDGSWFRPLRESKPAESVCTELGTFGEARAYLLARPTGQQAAPGPCTNSNDQEAELTVDAGLALDDSDCLWIRTSLLDTINLSLKSETSATNDGLLNALKAVIADIDKHTVLSSNTQVQANMSSTPALMAPKRTSRSCNT